MARKAQPREPGVSKVVLYKLLPDTPIDVALSAYDSVVDGELDGWGYRIFIRAKSGITPAWDPLIRGLVPAERVPRNSYASLVILFARDEAVYALTAGYGYAAVRNCAVPDFGTDLALKALDPNELAHLVQKVPTGNVYGHVRLLRGKYIPAGDPINARSVLKALKGKTLNKELGLSLEGRTSLAVTGKKTFTDVVHLLERIQEFEKSAQYSVPIKGLDEVSKQLASQLDEELVRRITDAEFDDVLLGYDDDLIFRHCDTVRVGRVDTLYPFEDTVAIVEAAKSQNPNNPTSVMVRGYNDEGEEVLSQHLLDIVEGEVGFEGNTYFRITRKWYKTNETYRQNIEDDFRAVGQVDSGYFGTWPHSDGKWADEGQFLETQSNADRFVAHTQKIDHIEFADLIDTKENFLIHVKRGKGAYLRNLFAQGYVSASMLRDDGFKDKVQQKYGIDCSEKYTILFGICPEGEQKIDSVFTLFAKVDFLERHDSLVNLGFDVKYCLIE